MVEIPPVNAGFPLILGRSKEGAMVRIGHVMTVVKPEELKKAVDSLAIDIELENKEKR